MESSEANGTLGGGGGAGKRPLEEMSKEELLKKCRSLLTIAQKAKQARDAIADENVKLKSSTSATAELLDSLTAQKLQMVTSMDQLQKENKQLQSHLEEAALQVETHRNKESAMDTECQGYKRQAARVTEENEQLLVHLDGLEAQIRELNRIGLEQQQQLLVLEQNNELILEANVKSSHSNSNEVVELQGMLAVTLEEVKKLKTENGELQAKILRRDGELDKHAAVIDDLNIELYKNRALAETLQNDLSSTNKRYNDNQIESSGISAELQNTNEKLREKLKVYHGKIVKLAHDIKRVKESKELILQSFKIYNSQANDWKDELCVFSLKLQKELSERDNRNAHMQQRIHELEEQLAKGEEEKQTHRALHESDLDIVKRLEDELRNMQHVAGENERLHQTVDVLRSQIANADSAKLERQHDVLKSIEEKNTHLSETIRMLEVAAAEMHNTMIVKEQHCVQMQTQIANFNAENQRFVEEIERITGDNEQLRVDMQRFNDLQTDYNKLEANSKSLTVEFEHLKNSLNLKDIECLKLQKEVENAKQYSLQVDELQEGHAKEKLVFDTTLEGNSRLISELKKAIEKLESDVESSRLSEAKLAEQTSEVIQQLRSENKIAMERIDELEAQVTNEASTGDVVALKRENAELLAEMNVMNQALKERGETISQQQAHCDEMLKKIQVYEGQLSKSQENVQLLQEELHGLRAAQQTLQKVDNVDNDDALSTSTISRCEESNRFKELEGSWEERYGKLRTYALKLKAKVREQQEAAQKAETERTDLQARLTISVKSIQSMQSQFDELHDQIDVQKADKAKLDQMNKDNLRLLGDITKKDDTVSKLKIQIDALTLEKTSLDAWKKQVGAKVQSLKKELEANTVTRKEFEARIQKLQADLAAKEKELAGEKEKHQATRSMLHESNNECKKQSVLNLEMQDYERSIKELSGKLEKKNEQVTQLRNQVDAQKSSVATSREQHRLFEERCKELEGELDATRVEVQAIRQQCGEMEAVIGEKDGRLDELREALEAARSESEDVGTQLSKIVAEHQKVVQMLRDEKDHFRNESVELEQRARAIEDELRLRRDELTSVTTEYQSYKVRAQSVLRQNQSRDVGVEEKLTEEAASLRAQLKISQEEIKEMTLRLEEHKSINERLAQEKHQQDVQTKELQSDYENAMGEIAKLNAKHNQTLTDHNETVRSLKLHTETLSQCYRQQISEQEVRHNREIIELQGKYDKAPHAQPEIPSLLVPTAVREEGEGSESVDSSTGGNNNNHLSMHPLEKLLSADQDQEIAGYRKQLADNETRVVHLTALLADSEQDLAKHVQMNKVLKEEIRRQQRSVEREKHAENLEYMKNVVFKFITLSNGDERQRLVPVLNTILKLSPEETSKLNMVARGDKSWSTYLPLWSPGKPQ